MLDTKYKYYNPLAISNDTATYSGWDPKCVPNTAYMSVQEIGFFNNSYSKLFKYWKPLFISSLDKKMIGYRLLWTTSLTRYLVGLKIFSLVTENAENFMFLIGEYLVGTTVHITSDDTDNKAQYESEFRDKNKRCVTDLQVFTYRLELFSFYDYRHFVGIIGYYYKKRANNHTCEYLLNTTDMAQLCVLVILTRMY